MNWLSRLNKILKSSLQLGVGQLSLYGLYQLGLRTGHYRRMLTASLFRLDELSHAAQFSLRPCIPNLPEPSKLLALLGDQVSQLYSEADEIVRGEVRLFGGQPVPLELALPGKLEYWTKYETNHKLTQNTDIKLIWEPGRFGWACKLAMAYYLTRDERYAQTFWQNTGLFLTSNLPYDGPHWSSAQEVAIRLVVLAFAVQLFLPSKYSTPARLASLAQAIAVHAERIPPTLVYARSQNNNHLIIEALGLYTASAALPEHPLASRWHRLGWKWMRHAFRTQISADGTYIQHSTNYHRLMLQAALWAFAVHEHAFTNEEMPSDITSLLEASTHWLWKLVDQETGQVPNLGHNDGAYILPLTICPFNDYRPVIYASAHVFLHLQILPQGVWEDMSYWFSLEKSQNQTQVELTYWHQSPLPAGLNSQPPYILHNPKNGSWGSLRVATYHSRPAHADQLHLDLWWRGYNLAQDAGTYSYNAPPPWENSLTSSSVHNTVVLDGKEFMQRLDKFLYLDWAQGKVVEYHPPDQGDEESLIAEHNGYRKIGLRHRRKVTLKVDGHWQIIDEIDGPAGTTHTARLHWLLPDWDYEVLGPTRDHEMNGYIVRICTPMGWVTLKVGILSPQDIPPQVMSFQLVRAGIVLFGPEKASPTAGWISPTYGAKIPALASIYEVTQTLPMALRSEWILPGES